MEGLTLTLTLLALEWEMEGRRSAHSIKEKIRGLESREEALRSDPNLEGLSIRTLTLYPLNSNSKVKAWVQLYVKT